MVAMVAMVTKEKCFNTLASFGFFAFTRRLERHQAMADSSIIEVPIQVGT
jgi:hypothetical protein